MNARFSTKTYLVISVFLLVIVSPTAAAKIIYVDADANGLNDGSSWADAYNYLQDALMIASAGDEVMVAQGVYKPDQFILSERPNLGRKETFQLRNGVAIRGGYAGLGEPDPNARDPELYKAILSGDLDGNDVSLASFEWQALYDFARHPSRNDNCYTVITGSGTDNTAILDGFTITAGHANNAGAACDCPQINGAGMYNYSGSPTLIDCTFYRNTVCSIEGCYWFGACGGGMYNSGSRPTLRNCRFVENIVFTGNVTSYGGGIFNLNSDPTLTDCVFRRNVVTGYDDEYYGGGMCNYGSNPKLTHCSFIGNSAEYSRGGGIYNDANSSPILTGCILEHNEATYGGGMYNGHHSTPTLTNCTFSGNSAKQDGGAMYLDMAASATLTNCILWGDTPQEIYLHLLTGVTVVTYANIQDGWPGTTNISLDPCFAEPGYWDPNGTPEDANDDFWVDGDYHLKSQAGRWNPKTQTWVQDDVTSPCIDAGDTSSLIGAEPFPNGGVINMGAYGGTAEASKSYHGLPVCEMVVAGDINGDCEVNFKDFGLMALHWLGANTTAPPADADRPAPPPAVRTILSLDKTAKAVVTHQGPDWWSGEAASQASVWLTLPDSPQQLLWQGDLVNIPHRILVGSHGKALATMDRWGAIGQDPIVFYDSQGHLVKRYLDPKAELLTEEEIPRIRQSVSSYWWSEQAHAEFTADAEHFILWLAWGRVLVFQTAGGGQIDSEDFRLGGSQRTKILETINLLKELEDPDDRITAARFAGWLGGTIVGPILNELLQDPYYRDGFWEKVDDPWQRFGDTYMWVFPRRYPVRKAAAEEMHIHFGQARGVIEEWIAR